MTADNPDSVKKATSDVAMSITNATHMPPNADSGATFLVAFWIPNCDRTEDPEMMADCLAQIINEERANNWPENPQPIGVSAIPAAQWVTPETLALFREFTEWRVSPNDGSGTP